MLDCIRAGACQNSLRLRLRIIKTMGNDLSLDPSSGFLCQLKTDSNDPPNQIGVRMRDRQFWKQALGIVGMRKHDVSPRKKRHLIHSSFEQIEKDVSRTFPNEEYFNEQANKQRFDSLLKKFALYFPKLGYTQGLNFIAAYLLLAGYDDYDAFQVLTRLMLHEKLLLVGLYQDSFPLVKLYCSLFWELLRRKLPKLASKITESHICDEAWLFQWFISFYLYSFPNADVKRYIDYILVKKECAMVSLAVGIVKNLQEDILRMESIDEMEMFDLFEQVKQKQICNQKLDPEKIISYADSITREQVMTALGCCRLKNNIYYVYFLKESERKEIYYSIIQKLARERKMFRLDPTSKEYERDESMVRQFEKVLLQKSKQLNHGIKGNFYIKQSEQNIRSTNHTDSRLTIYSAFCQEAPVLEFLP